MLNQPHNLWSRLWLNDGKGAFTEVPSSALCPIPRGPGWRILPFDFKAAARRTCC